MSAGRGSVKRVTLVPKATAKTNQVRMIRSELELQNCARKTKLILNYSGVIFKRLSQYLFDE